MLDAIATVIINPVRFFREMAENPKRADGAFWVVLLVMALVAVVGYFSVLPQLDAFGPDSPFASFAVIGGIVGAIVFTLAQWLLFGLLVRIGAGMEARPWAVVGYGMAPFILISAITLVLAALFPVEVTPITASPQDPEAFQEAFRQFNQELRSSTFVRSSTVLNYLGAAWWLVLIFLGVRETTGQTNKAVRSAVLIGILYLAFFLIPFLLAPTGT